VAPRLSVGKVAHSQLLGVLRFLSLAIEWYPSAHWEVQLSRAVERNKRAAASCLAPVRKLAGRLRSGGAGGHEAETQHRRRCAAFAGLDADAFEARQACDAAFMVGVLKRMARDVQQHGARSHPPGSAGDDSRVALLPHVLLYLYVCTAGVLDFPALLVVGDSLRPVRPPGGGPLRIEYLPPWTQHAPRRLLLDEAAQVGLRWLLARLPTVTAPNVWSGLSHPAWL
jgi:hypothetical protein